MNIRSVIKGGYIMPKTEEQCKQIREDTKNKNVEPLIEWLLSPEGQALIEACGYVGIG